MQSPYKSLTSTASSQSQSVPIKMRSVLCGAVVLCLLQCCTAVPLEEFVGYPFSNETHQVHRIPPYSYYYYYFPVNISQPFVIDGRGMTGFRVSHTWMLNANVIVPTTPAPAALLQCPNTLIARSSVLGGIIIFKLELYVLRYLRTYLLCYCMSSRTDRLFMDLFTHIQ